MEHSWYKIFLTNIFNGSINKELHKIKYLIFQHYSNCKIYNLLQIPALMPEDDGIDWNM